MAQYRITQKYFTFRDSFGIDDIYTGEPRFVCKGELSPLSKRFVLLRTDKQQAVSVVRKRLGRIFPRFDVYRGAEQGEPFATAKVRLSFFRKKIRVKSGYGDFLIYGGKTDWDFSVYAGSNTSGEIVATISKRIGLSADTYDIDIIERGKEGFLLSLCLIVNYLYHKRR